MHIARYQVCGVLAASVESAQGLQRGSISGSSGPQRLVGGDSRAKPTAPQQQHRVGLDAMDVLKYIVNSGDFDIDFQRYAYPYLLFVTAIKEIRQLAINSLKSLP